MSRDPLRDPEPLIRRVYSYAAYRLGDGPDAEDVTGEALARAVRYRSSYDPRKGAPVEWLIGIARRCADDALGRRPGDTVREEPEGADQVAPGDLAEEAIDRLSLRAAVAKLGERDRELIALRYGADLSARRIGALLDMRTNAVEVALHRALGRLRVELGDSPGKESAAAAVVVDTTAIKRRA